ncbi:hypothetical protein [Roseovarius salinarum]|uniref:hypothetical protein n=1 Tax=Roseovarius salinarum TaxID=1981892 RepID=UPI000C33866E|nr:hypothetical protein [Roseovarius salinarum]
MSFSDAVQQMPPQLRIWVLWLTFAMIAAPLVLLCFRQTRRDGAVVLAASFAVITAMQLLYQAVGFTRLLGLAHVLIWGPLAVYLALRLRQGVVPRLPRAVIAVFLVTIGVSLVFDVVDVVRYLAGDRAPLVPLSP